MAFPSTLSSFPRPTATDRLNSPSHSGLHNTVSSALGQVEAVIGVDGANSVLGTIIGDLRSPGSSGGGHVQSANKGGTGQITYAKGDILVAQSTSVLSKLTVAPTDGLALITDSTQSVGVRWGVPGSKPTLRVYSTPSTLTWVKPSNLSYIQVVVQGAGAAGGGTDASASGWAPGGGSSGAWSIKFYTSSMLSATETVVIGVKGVGSIGGVGKSGGFSSFSVGANSVRSNGGIGGNGADQGQGLRSGGASPIASGYDFFLPGKAGEQGKVYGGAYFGGNGGDSPYNPGGRGRDGTGSVAGTIGSIYGSGGGGYGLNGSGANPGYDGADGLVIVSEY